MATKWRNTDGVWQPWKWLLACDLTGVEPEIVIENLAAWQVETTGVVCYTDAEADAAGLTLDGLGIAHTRKAVALTAGEQAAFDRLSGAKAEQDKAAADALVSAVVDKPTRDALGAVLGILTAALDAVKGVG